MVFGINSTSNADRKVQNSTRHDTGLPVLHFRHASKRFSHVAVDFVVFLFKFLSLKCCSSPEAAGLNSTFVREGWS